MRSRTRALGLATALAVSASAVTALGLPAYASDEDTDWRSGWCRQGEGLSVVVDFGDGAGDGIGAGIPPEGYSVRCLVGGVIEPAGPNSTTRINALVAVGHEVEYRGSWISAIDGVEEWSGDATDWFFSGTQVPGAWDNNYPDIVTGGANIDKAFGARLLDPGFVHTVPIVTPQFAVDPTPTPEPDPTPTPTPTPTPAPTSDPSPALAAPKATGVHRVGNTLTAKSTGWPTGATAKYQWLRNGKAIKGATTAKYALRAQDKGKKVSVRVVVSVGQHRVTRISPAHVVKPGKLTAKTVKISGKTKVGARLKVSTKAWKPGKVTLKYRWLRNGKAIKGATGKTYVLKRSDRGKRISVKVTGSKAGYTTLSRTSAKTRTVSR